MSSGSEPDDGRIRLAPHLRGKAALFVSPMVNAARFATPTADGETREHAPLAADLGYVLYANRTLLFALAALLFALSVVTALPAFLLMRVVIVIMASVATSFQLAVVVAMFIELITRFDGHVAGTFPGKPGFHDVRIAVHHGVPRLIGVVAIVAAVFSLIALVNTSLGLAGCPVQRDSNQTLAAWLFNNDTLLPGSCPGGEADWTALQRRPRFAVEFHWFQLCLDERPLGIAFAVFCAALIVVDIVVAVVHFRMPYDTRRIVTRPLASVSANLQARVQRF